jgi:hypothetical protein
MKPKLTWQNCQDAAFLLAFVAIFCLICAVWRLQNRVSAIEKAKSQPQSKQPRQQSELPNQSSALPPSDQPKFSLGQPMSLAWQSRLDTRKI